MDIPNSVSGIDAAWLNHALEQSGTEHPGVQSVTATPMPGIVGALGEVGIVDIAWGGPTDLPTSMVAKCPLDDDIARLYNSVMQNYIREAGFYRDLAHRVPMRVPKCFVNAEADDKSAHMLLIEKIDGADGDIFDGASLETMAELVGKMATMHGQFWMSDDLLNIDWMLDWQTESLKLGIPITQESWAAFQAAEPTVYPADVVAFCEGSWINDTEYWLDAYANRPWTFTHIDFELDNMIHTADETVVLDWQTCLRSFPGVDLAWLLATSASDELVAREDELLDHYRATLLASGGPNWSHDEVVEELAWGTLYPVACQPVPNMADTSAYGANGERMKARFRAFLDRSLVAAQRWDLVGHCSPHLRS